MSQLIVTSRYLKNGNQKNKTKRRNYTKYIVPVKLSRYEVKNLLTEMPMQLKIKSSLLTI